MFGYISCAISEALEHYQLALAIDADFTLAEFNSGLTYQVTTGAGDPMMENIQIRPDAHERHINLSC